MPQGTLSNFCERCGRRVDVRRAAPGDRDVGLDRIREAFRYCSTCQLFVGRSCCWNADVHACTHCSPPGSDDPITSPLAVTARKAIAVRRLADLSESIADLRKVGEGLDERTAGGRTLSARNWDDAWQAAGWLIARADTSRDAIARVLWPPPPEPESARARFERFHEQLADLMKDYLEARVAVEQRLTMAGLPIRAAEAKEERGWLRSWLAPWLRPWPRPWRTRPMATAVIGGAAAVLVIAAGFAIVGGRVPEMGILGGHSTPLPTGGTEASEAASAPGEPEPAAPVVRADLDFDLLRVGALQGASAEIAGLVGVNEVVPFPSPFDRSIRMAGSGSHRFCVSVPGLDAREVSVEIDLYLKSSPFSTFELAAIPSDGPGSSTGVPAELVASLQPGRWYHLDASWRPGETAAIEIRDDEGGEPLRGQAPAPLAAPAAPTEGLCVSASGMASDGELMLDNLRVEQ